MILGRPKDIGFEHNKLKEHGIWRADNNQWWFQVCPYIGYSYLFRAGDIKDAIVRNYKQYVDAPVIDDKLRLVGNGFHVNVKDVVPRRKDKMPPMLKERLISLEKADTSTKGQAALGVFLRLYHDVDGPQSHKCVIITDKDEQNKCRDVYVPRYDVYVEIKYDFQGGCVYTSYSQKNKYASFMIQTHERNYGGHH
jgi:hypothetical protein